MATQQCLKLRHQRGLRLRFAIATKQPLHWPVFEQYLASTLSTRNWSYRINIAACSVVISALQADSPSKLSPSHLKQQAEVLLIAALNAAGAIPPDPSPIKVHLKSPFVTGVQSLVHGLLNLVSGIVSIATLSLCLFLLIVGVLGMAFPMQPTISLIAFAFILFEFALRIRAPFVSAS